MADQSSNERHCSVARLTDDLIVEILSRVPVKSFCRFNCVSKHWQALMSHPEHRRKLPQTLSGFLYVSFIFQGNFISAPGKGYPLITAPSLAFLPMHHQVTLLDCCKGLLLCRWYDVFSPDHGCHYVICNPAMESWAVLPDSSQTSVACTACLGFDPAVSPHFHVFELDHDQTDLSVNVIRVEVYSSKSGGWVHKGWKNDMLIDGHQSATVFTNGYLHFNALDDEALPCLAAVDTEANTWRKIPVPGGEDQGFIQQSQGRLHYANFQRCNNSVLRLQVYVLEDYGSQEWILKHSIESSKVFGQRQVNFRLVAIHPDRNLIFFNARRENTLMCYDMDSQQVKLVYDNEGLCWPPYMPYVPLYLDLPALHG